MKAVAPLLLSLITVLGTSRFTAADEPLPRYDRRWVWVMANLLVDAEADRVVALVERAARDGYNGLVVSDYKLNILGKMPERYFDHVARLRAVADQARIELIPTVFPIGYGNGLLSHDANLAEGMQVDGAPFVVQGGEAPPLGWPTAIWRRRAAKYFRASASRTRPAKSASWIVKSSTAARRHAAWRIYRRVPSLGSSRRCRFVLAPVTDSPAG